MVKVGYALEKPWKNNSALVKQGVPEVDDQTAPGNWKGSNSYPKKKN